jgi:chemotaxis response regulator CheB
MGKRRLPRKDATSGERLRRYGEEAERFGQPREIPIENLIVIGASAGGHVALKEVVGGLSRDIPAAVVIMLHMAAVREQSASHLENFLREYTDVPVATVHSADRLKRGMIYVTPPGQSVLLQGRMLLLEPHQQVHPVTTINRLFESAAKEYQDRVTGVILTGFLRDGTAGLKAVHDAGGLTIVQDPTEAEYADMPTNAMQDLPVTFCLKLAEIGPVLDLLVRRKTELETGLAVSVRMLKERVALLGRLLAQSQRNPGTHQFLSSEIISLERDLRSIQALLNEAMAFTKKADGSNPE